MTKATYTYQMPILGKPDSKYDVAANMALFMAANGLSIFDTWSGYMRAVDQRRIFGVKLGKGKIYIDGDLDRASCRVKTCFGSDSEESVWIDCQRNLLDKNFHCIGKPTGHALEIEQARDRMGFKRYGE